MKTIILARVSTEEQKEAGNSLPSQLFRLRKYADDKGLEIQKEYTFDESAYKEKREKFNEIIKTLKESKEPVALCCDKIDRLLRNFTKDLVDLEEMRKSGKLDFILHQIISLYIKTLRQPIYFALQWGSVCLSITPTQLATMLSELLSRNCETENIPINPLSAF